MIQTPLFKKTFALLFIIAVLNFISNELYLQWTFWWIDVLLHFLSGATVAMATIIVWNHFGRVSKFHKLKIIAVAVFSAFVVGIIWEIYELYFGITFLSDGIVYVRDTASDLIMDICGGFFGTLHALSFQNNKEVN